MNNLTFLFLLGILLAFPHVSTGQSSEKFIFDGQIIGRDSGFVYLQYKDVSDQDITDSCRLKSGYFRFTGFISQPTEAYLTGKKTIHHMSNPLLVTVYLEQGFIRGRFPNNKYKEGTITGSKSQRQQEFLKAKLAPMDKSIDSIKKLINIVRQNKDSDYPGNLNKARRSYRHKRDSVILVFIFEHPDSYVGVERLGMLMGNHKLALDSVVFLYNRVSPGVKKSRWGRWLHKTLSEQLTPGEEAPDFSQKSADGGSVSLHDFRGRYVLLNFWASWCAPCIEEMQYLKKLKKTFKRKDFAIVGISLDDDRNKWIAAIKEHRLDWLQLSDLRGNQNEVAIKYNVHPIPDNFLIGPNGHILARITNTDSLVSTVMRFLPYK